MITINIKIPEDLHRDLKIIAAKTGNSLKSVIIMALEDLVKRQENKERS
jgi:predicted transcriptional regulator